MTLSKNRPQILYYCIKNLNSPDDQFINLIIAILGPIVKRYPMQQDIIFFKDSFIRISDNRRIIIGLLNGKYRVGFVVNQTKYKIVKGYMKK